MRRAPLLFVALGCASSAAREDDWRQPDRVVAALGLAHGDRVADVGAGGGILTFRLAEAVGPGGRVVATDVDPAALMRLFVRRAGRPEVEIRAVRPEHTGLEAGGYDCVVLAQVDHLLPDRVAYLRELRAALGPRGRLAVSNRAYHRQALVEAARAAGYAVTPALDFNQQFLVILTPEDPEQR